MKEHRQLRMKSKYIAWTVCGKKCATTRLSQKPLGDYVLGTKLPFKKFNSYGVVVEFTKVYRWTLGTVSPKRLLEIATAEGFASSEEFVAELYKINANRIDGKKLDKNTPLFTHFYKVLEVPDRMRQLYDD